MRFNRNAALQRSLCALFALGITSGSANATTAMVTFGSASVAWDSSDSVVRLEGVGTEEISWGRLHQAGGYRQSAYRFDAVASGLSAGADQIVSLGTFTHNNFAIQSGQNLMSASLSYDLGFSFDLGHGLHQETLSFDWLFSHNETLNSQAPLCADGTANGVGVNRNGCADHVSFSGQSNGVYSFQYAEGTVTLELLGFSPGTEFWTIENEKNSSQLRARFNFAPAPVPLPASGWLLLGGLAGLALVRRMSLAG